MGFIGLSGASWGLSLHLAFNYLNSKDDFHLFRVWMKASQELPVRSEEDYEVVGLPREENKAFWLTEKRLNSLWIKVSSSFIFLSCIVFSAQLFLVPFDIDMVTYSVVQAVHVVHSSYSLIIYMHSFFSINLFYVFIMQFTSKRIAYISKKVERLCSPKTQIFSSKKMNYKIAKCIFEYSRYPARSSILSPNIPLNSHFLMQIGCTSI